MKIYFLFVFILITSITFAQETNYTVEQLEKRLDSLILNTMESEHIPGAAYIILKDGKTILKKGYGYSSLGKDAKLVSPDSTIFRIGSITKTFTATALLQLKDKNRLDLNEDVNTYLKHVKVPTTFKEPVTSFHLLTHSAGFDELKGRVVYKKDLQIPLATFLNGRLIRVRKPGIVSAYSTFGIALAGLLIEDISGLNFEEYMRKFIWEPLDMTMTSMQLPKNQQHFAVGYEYEKGINVPQPWEWYHTFPASSINSTATDMGKYMQMLLNLGTLNSHKILEKATASKMLQQQLAVQPEVDGFGFGLFEKKVFGMQTFNHGGDMLGYSTYMTLIPERNIGIFVAHHHEGTNLRDKIIEMVLENFGTVSEVNPNPKKMEMDLSMFVGTYRWMSDCKTCPNSEQQRSYQLIANDDHTLSGFNRKFYQVSPLVFKSYDGKRTMGFFKSEKGEIQYMSLGNINAFEKIK